MSDQPFEFGQLCRAAFMQRPNRFVVRCRLPNGAVAEAFLPNPGRLWELLLPGATVLLWQRQAGTAGQRTKQRRQPGARPSTASGGRNLTARLPYVAVAVERDGEPVFLHTHLTNRLAQFLIERQPLPGLAGAEVVRSEVPVGRSRIDFLVRRGRRRFLMEVKSVTLFGNRVAMFPDAVTERGRRHLMELAERSRPQARPCVLFLVHTQQVDYFMPDYHTDPAFGRTMLELRGKLDFLPVAVQWLDGLRLGPRVKTLRIPWWWLERELHDSGSYLLLLRLDRSTSLQVGRLGRQDMRPGWYVYVGSAAKGLAARLARHQRGGRRLHWHVDYLRQRSSAVVTLPVRSADRLECSLAAALSSQFDPGPAGFGCSDCSCPTHLYHSPTHPLEQPGFVALLQRFRMRRPGQSC